PALEPAQRLTFEEARGRDEVGARRPVEDGLRGGDAFAEVPATTPRLALHPPALALLPAAAPADAGPAQRGGTGPAPTGERGGRGGLTRAAHNRRHGEHRQNAATTLHSLMAF